MSFRALILSFATMLAGLVAQARPDITDVAQLVVEEEYRIALDSLETMIARDSLDDAAWFYLGLCKLELGENEAAQSALERAVALDPDNTDYIDDLLAVYENNRSEKLDSLYMDVMERFPRKYRTPYTLSLIADNKLYNSGNDSLALRYYEEALAMDDTYAPALLGRAEAHRMGGNLPAYFSEIVPFLRTESIAVQPKCSYIMEFLRRIDGRSYRVWGPQVDAMLDAVAEAHPADSAALVLAGSWFYNREQKEKGRAYFDQWLEADPSNKSAIYTNLSIVKEMEGEAAMDALCQKLIRTVKDVELKASLMDSHACYLFENGRSNEAFKLFEQALKLSPDDSGILNNYAYFLCVKKKKLKTAEKMARKAVEAEPENLNVLDTYGWILHLRHKDDEAKVVFKKAIIYGGKDSDVVLEHYIVVLEALGEKDRASYYKSILQSRKKK